MTVSREKVLWVVRHELEWLRIFRKEKRISYQQYMDRQAALVKLNDVRFQDEAELCLKVNMIMNPEHFAP